jgi:hypothetical protein
VEREFGFKGIEQFVLETTEGNGVLHMVWAWRGARSFYVPQAWLSEQWEKIHGAPVVWVRKMGLARRRRSRCRPLLRSAVPSGSTRGIGAGLVVVAAVTVGNRQGVRRPQAPRI